MNERRSAEDTNFPSRRARTVPQLTAAGAGRAPRTRAPAAPRRSPWPCRSAAASSRPPGREDVCSAVSSAQRRPSGVKWSKSEAGALARHRVPGLDRVGEAARAAHHRRRAVAQAVHLVEAARLVARRHEEEVGAGLDPVRQLLVVAAEVPGLAREARPGARRGTTRTAPRRCRARRSARRGGRGTRAACRSSRSNPFCAVSRETMPSTGASLRVRQADLLEQRALHLAPCRRASSRRVLVREVRVASPGSTRRSRRR